jgi:hypothetical protein
MKLLSEFLPCDIVGAGILTMILLVLGRNSVFIKSFRFLLTFSQEAPNIVGNKTSETLLTLGIQAEAQKFSSSAMLSCQKKNPVLIT